MICLRCVRETNNSRECKELLSFQCSEKIPSIEAPRILKRRKPKGRTGWNRRDRGSFAMMALRLAVKSQQSLSWRKRGKQYLLHTSVIPLPARKLWILKNASLLGEAILFFFLPLLSQGESLPLEDLFFLNFSRGEGPLNFRSPFLNFTRFVGCLL